MVAMRRIVVDSVFDMQRECIRAVCDHHDLFPFMEPVLMPVCAASVQPGIINLQMLVFECDNVYSVRRDAASPIGIIAAPGDRLLCQCFRIQ